MPGRRSFLLQCGTIAALPVMGGILPSVASRCDPAFASPAVAMRPQAEGGPADLAFRIDGWDQPGDSGNEVWLRISSSWRATWR